MDTLFRLVSFHHQQQDQDHHPDQHSFTTTTSTSTSFHHHHLEDDVEECCNTTPIFSSCNFMDEDLSSSSSSKNHHHHPHPSYPSSTYTSTSTTPPHHPSFESSPLPHVDPSSPTWSTDLLLDCARAVSSRDSARAHRLLWALNELSSPYGEPDQKLSYYFLHALFARLTSSGPRSLLALSSASDRSSSFDSTRRTSLLFQQSSPWSPFCHVSSNSSLLDHLENHPRIHVLDLGTTFCTQWPTFLESLATRSSEETPHLRLTSVVASPHPSTSVHCVMKEISARMEKFARLMGVPFAFRYVHHSGDLTTLDLASLCSTHPDEALAVNCINSLHAVPTRGGRETVLAAIRRLRPRVVTLVEEEADMCTDENADVEGEGFQRMFRESVRFFSAYFDSLEESFPKTSNERLALERAAGRAVMDLVACEPAQCGERRETGRAWSGRMREAGFEPVGLSEDGADDVRALLRRYREGWSLLHGSDVDESSAGIYLAWKGQPVVWASTWKPMS